LSLAIFAKFESNEIWFSQLELEEILAMDHDEINTFIKHELKSISEDDVNIVIVV
jgi:hypothetical protein